MILWCIVKDRCDIVIDERRERKGGQVEGREGKERLRKRLHGSHEEEIEEKRNPFGM